MTSPRPARQGRVARAFRYLYRVPLLLVHILLFLPLILLLMTPPFGRLGTAADPLESKVVRWWSGGLMWIFGFRLHRYGQPLPGAVLFVANHVGWVDISMIHSQKMVGFVAKREIAGWPLVGWVASRGHTIYHQRGNTESLGGVMEEMTKRLREDRPVAVFPEGRTRGGHEVGPFHARIFQAAVETSVPVQPVALRYGVRGDAQTWVAFAPGDAFLFGPETRGLPDDVLAGVPDAQRLRLPMRPHNRSLNLSNAVAVTVFEAWRQLGCAAF